MDLRRIVEEHDTKAGRIFDIVIQSLIIFSLITFCIDTLPNLSKSTEYILQVVEIITVIIFTMEYLLRIVVAQKKNDYIFSFYGLVDLISILPFYLAIGVDLRSVRVLRMFRLFRIFKMFRYNKAMRRFRDAFLLVKEELILFLMACGFLIFIASVGIYYFEREAQPEVFASVFHSMWWSVVTLTTVGYGDAYPITVGGRIFTFFILIIGLGIVAIPAGVIASAMQEQLDEKEQKTNNNNSFNSRK